MDCGWAHESDKTSYGWTHGLIRNERRGVEAQTQTQTQTGKKPFYTVE